MSKEALKSICLKCEKATGKNKVACPFRSISNDYCEEYNIIEKELKALEIIKEKEVNFEVFGAFETYKDYEIYYDKKFHLIENKLTQEEFNLLKEVFRNDK